MKKLLFDTRPVGGNILSEKPLWQGYPLPERTIEAEELSVSVGKETRLDPLDVQYIWTKTGSTILALVREGYNVDLDWLAFDVTVLGSFENSDSAFDLSKNRLAVRAHVRPPVRDCLAAIVPENVNGRLVAKIQSLMDTASQTEGLITVASKILVSGNGLLIDPSREDEGVALCTKSGEAVAVPTILANDASTLDLAFDELPPDGDYVLVVKARNGEPVSRKPAVARRNVTVAKASV